ncbi:tryptophan-rich sensory protein [Belnapia sp. T18]|uniref:Tryptophan-rich sensory protein n=1 Tax=Belnapia arida TaxID=2804533 RepID=A0ABS1U1G5_9PROT|nr:TspO/MBR family protein [Belnapia arida]MBL6078524.1 tryptophan-rich sensory protein [Belnapia arida]
MNSTFAFLGFFAACFLVACSGAVFRPGDWYENLAKPSWNPPNWLFAPAWTLLYILIAIAGWLVWREAGFVPALALYGVQLLLNAGWSAVFFGLKRPDLAFGELVLLWLSILGCILLFAPISTTAAWLMVPYLAWVTFAGALNFAIWQRNPRPA